MVEKAQFNPFAYQTAPLNQVQYTGTPQPVAEPQPQVKNFGFAARPQKQTYAPQSSGDVDHNFVKNTFAYVPFTNSPVSNTDYDDSDYRGRGVYCCA